MRLRFPKNAGRLVFAAAAIVLFVYLVRTLAAGNSLDQFGGDTTTVPTTSTTPPTEEPTVSPLVGFIIGLILGLVIGYFIRYLSAPCYY